MITPIIGIDEVGRGPLAGPVITAAVYFDPQYTIPPENRGFFQDSKKLSAKKRLAAYNYITQHPHIHWALGAASVEEINTHNILQATFIAMRRAYERLPGNTHTHTLLVDGSIIPPWPDLRVQAIIKGDSLYPEISAASIIAKECRDHLMTKLHQRYPYYRWDANAGYGTAAHMTGIRAQGITRHHRPTFAPIRKHIETNT